MQNKNSFLNHKFWEIGVGMAYYFHFLLWVIFINERATLARATRVVIHSVLVFGPSALGKGESYL